jgi:membrane protein implicated in regulation of membrane protease activity
VVVAVMPYIWLAIIVLAVLLEMGTTQLISIWFAAGGVGALIAYLVGATELVQICVFILITGITLAFTRPFAQRALGVKKTSTNADRYIGKVAVVTVEINNTLGTGQVNVLGSIWTARSSDGSVIPVGAHAVVESIDGVKLIVRKIND